MKNPLELLRSRLRKPGDFSSTFRAFFTDDFEYEGTAAGKFLRDAHLRKLVPRLLERYKADLEFTPVSTEKHLRDTAAEAGVKAGLLINAMRVALTGQGVAPGLFELMRVLGRKRTLARMERLTNYLLTNDD